MKKIISMLLAAVIAVSVFAFPVSANGNEELVTITEDMISVEGATIEYDSYLSAYKITPVAAGETVTLKLTETRDFLTAWLPATAADESLWFTCSSEHWWCEDEVVAGHKFQPLRLYIENESASISFTTTDVYSVYLYDKMCNNEIENVIVDIANGSLAEYDEAYLDLDTYEVERYTKYYWDNDIVFNESFFVLQEKDGSIAPQALMYDIDRVVSVKNSYLNREYVYGKDYLVEDGKLIIPEGSSIRSYSYDTVYKTTDPQNIYWDNLNGGYLYAGQYDMYFVGYMNITYTVKDTWNGPVPESKGMYLDNITQKLNSDGETVKILGIGDSIAGGANVSSDIGDKGVAPYADAWSQMTSKAIQERYPNVNVEYDVIAQGGATATLAIERMNEIVAYDPDLLMIEFGTNECMAGESDAYYINTLTQAIAAVNENLPDCDIILVAPIISNPLIFPADWFYAYADALYSLEREGVAIADSTSILQYLISRKDYIDMTGDFLCHPNDYANRVFVQTILKTLEDGSESDYINGLADRITKYRYAAEFDAADWESLTSLAAEAKADIASSTTAEEAREKYMAHTDILDAIPTSAENVANSALDTSKLIFANTKPLDAINAANNVNATFDADEKAMSLLISATRNPSITLDYTAGDTDVSADDYDRIILTVKAPLTNGTKAKQTKLTFTTDTGTCAAITVDLILDGKYHSYIIDVSADTKWAGEIKSLKIQPFAASSTRDVLFVSSIILASDAENAADIAIERERIANKDAAEAVTYLMADDATCDILQTESGESYVKGDSNSDGLVSAIDSLLMKKYIITNDADGINLRAMDMDGDGNISPADSFLIKLILSGRASAEEAGGAEADISYSTAEKAAQIDIAKTGAVLTVDLSSANLSADMFKYVTVCAKAANGEAVGVTVTLNYENGTSEKAMTVSSTALFNAETAKFTEASGVITSITLVFDCEAGETVYLDSLVFTPTLSAAENAEIVRVGAANLY